MDDEREPHRPRYELETYLLSIHDDDNNTRFSVRRCGKLFHIHVSPSEFINSPITTRTCMSYLELLRSGEEAIGDVYDTDIWDWVTQPFEPLFVELAPSPVPPDDHANITVTLKEHLLPDLFTFALDVVDERLHPRRIETKSRIIAAHVWLDDDDDLDDLETWTTLYDPAGIVLSFSDPGDALFKRPKKVLIDNMQTACFFKPCFSAVQTKNELQAYKKIASANLDPHLNICRLLGAVMDDDGSILGLLLTYINHGGHTLSTNVDPDYPSASTKKRRMDQIEATVTELHRQGLFGERSKQRMYSLTGRTTCGLLILEAATPRAGSKERLPGLWRGIWWA